ncbi:hypothetical protein DNTS_017100 [Danionella cerebrum]|uniref:G domain-containing protein n=1 Tax=Danionella cerebrum TaxID=2873325 RepID=A0A553NG72_9TELE|nr:hypothetical protein DNTS_017100 [Danionella translucida]
MGKWVSKESETESSDEIKAWRVTPWGEKEALVTKLKGFQLETPNVTQMKILVIGEIGAGKSSFINSINSVFQKRITNEAIVNKTTDSKTCTKIYKTYYIKHEQSHLPFVLSDTMGLESGNMCGVLPEDILKVMEGYIKERYRFRANAPISPDDDQYRSVPSLQDQTFCLVYVIAADRFSLEDAVFDKMKDIKNKACELEIPQVVILTRVDEACPLVHKSLKKIYNSKKIKEKMEMCSERLGVTVSNIFPVKCYHEEIDTQNDVDVLLLRAFLQIVHIANDALKMRFPHKHPKCKKISMGNSMGQRESKEPEFEDEWRQMPWGEKETLEQDLQDYTLCNPGLESINILLVGPAGAGKSSFINSVVSAFQGRITTGAFANSIQNQNCSFTKAFNPTSMVCTEDEEQKSSPDSQGKTFCLVYVMPADKISLMDASLLNKFNQIRLKSSDMGIPQAIILTRVDEICPLVKKDLRKIYTSKKIKEKIQMCSNLVGVPMSHIYPVKNYHEEIDTNNDADVMILRAFTHLVQIASLEVKFLKKTYQEVKKWEVQNQNQSKGMELKTHLEKFVPSNPDIKVIKILLVGAVGAGKSSFINSVISVFKGRIVPDALCSTTFGSSSFSRRLTGYRIRNKDGNLPYELYDVRGLEAAALRGCIPEDIISTLQGHVKEGYKFKKATPHGSSDERAQGSPPLSDQAFCLVYIIDANTVNLSDPTLIEKLKSIRQNISDKVLTVGIPQVIVLANVDEASELVKKDLRKVYKSKTIKNKIDLCHNCLGVPLTSIFPVKNYHDEIETNADIECQKDEFQNGRYKLKTSGRDLQNLKSKLENVTPSRPEVKQIQVLIAGQIGAGKSSFINTICSTFKGRIVSRAQVNSADVGHSFTQNLKGFTIRSQKKELPIVLKDIMGLEPEKLAGAQPDDIISTLYGHFDPKHALSSENQHYTKDPSLSDQCFCLVYIIDANTLEFVNDKVLEKMNDIRNKIRSKGIPQVIVMTKVDEVCPLVNKDLNFVYRSKKIKEKMELCSAKMGLPLMNIFPVKNYHIEVETNDVVDYLQLMALQQILNLADDRMLDDTAYTEKNINPSSKPVIPFSGSPGSAGPNHQRTFEVKQGYNWDGLPIQHRQTTYRCTLFGEEKRFLKVVNQ